MFAVGLEEQSRLKNSVDFDFLVYYYKEMKDSSKFESDSIYDLVIIGGGPAGLSAAINAGLEGLKTLVIDKEELGGTCKNSYQIKNYMGFNQSITGYKLIKKAKQQALDNGAEIIQGYVTKIGELSKGGLRVITCRNNKEGLGLDFFGAEAILITSGTDCRRLAHVGGLEEAVGKGVFYHDMQYPYIQDLDNNKSLVVVGAGNSAAQAACVLSLIFREVHMLVRGEELNMANDWVKSVEGKRNVFVHKNSELTFVKSHNGWVYNASFREGKHLQDLDTSLVLMFVGSEPAGNFGLDSINGFIKTNHENYETSVGGIFAAGDIRYGSNKQIISAAGEGAAAIPHIIKFLKGK